MVHKPTRLLWSMGEAAWSLGICTKTLLREVQAGNIRFVMLGRNRKFTPEDLQDFIRRQTVLWGTDEARVRYTRSVRSAGRTRIIGFEEALRLTPRKRRE